MAQRSDKAQIFNMKSVASASFTPLICPISKASKVTIYNVDGSVAITVSTDDNSGDTAPVISVAHGTSQEIDIGHWKNWQTGEVICFVSGAVTTQPVVLIE